MQEPYYSTTGYPVFNHHHHGSFQGHHGYRSHVRSPVSSMGRSTPDSDDYCTQQNKFKMKWILSLGLLLPALAAVIGVVAWAVSAEVVMGARRASALRASEAAFHLSQSPRELEWHSLVDNDNHNNNNDALSPPGPNSTGGKDDDYDGNVIDVTTLSSLVTSMRPSRVKTASVKDIFSISSASPSPSSTVTPVTSRKVKQTTTSTTTTTTSTTSTKRPVSPGSSESWTTISPGKSDKNITSIFFLSGTNGGKSKSEENINKKSPGDQVAAVINQLVASRNYKGSTRPQIVVVAPLTEKKKKKDFNVSIDSTSSVTVTSTSLPTSTSTLPTTGLPRTSEKVTRETIVTTTSRPTTRSAKSKSSHSKSSKVRSTSTTVKPSSTTVATVTTTKVTTTTEEPDMTTVIESADKSLTKAILSRDADTLMAAAHMLSARHKMISMRSDDDEDETLDNPTIPSKLYAEQYFTTAKPTTTVLPANRVNYQHFPPPRSLYDLPGVKRDDLPVQHQHQHHQQHHQHHSMHHQVSPAEQGQQHHSSDISTGNHVNYNFNNQMQQMMPGPQVASAPLPPPVNRDSSMSSERMSSMPFPGHYASNMMSAGRSSYASMQSPPLHLQIRMQGPRQQSIHQAQPQPQQSEQVPLFVGQMAPQSSSSIQSNSALRFTHIPPPASINSGVSHPHQHMRHPAFTSLAASPIMLQAVQLSQQQQQQQQQQTSSPAVMVPFTSLPLHHQQQVTPASNYMTGSVESSPSASINPEAVDESQVVSNSAVSPVDQSSSNSNAMLSIHANDPQAAASSSKGLTLHFGGGPKSGSSQLITSPVGIFKTMLFPLLPKPRLNLNGKVVFGVVLDSHINKGKKTILHARNS